MREDELPLFHEIPLSQLDVAGAVRAKVGDVEILAVKTAEGVRVYDGVCPHLGGPLLEAVIKDGVLRCPWHAYDFDLASGRCLTPPGRPWWRMMGDGEKRRAFRIELRPLKFDTDGGRIRVALPKR